MRSFTEYEKLTAARMAAAYTRHIQDKREEDIWELSMMLSIDESDARELFDIYGGY